jgi:hypothetical protein
VRDELAERVLATVMGWDPAQLAEGGSKLQTLARHKYDSYEGYRPGVKFLENLAGWLAQFDDIADRRAAIQFVLEDLVFVSRGEIDHLIETVYPDFIRPMLVREVAARLSLSRFAVSEITRSEEFRKVQRKLLVLGLSDGARIDRLRRSSPGLSHEQIYLAADIGDETAEEAVKSLREALDDEDARFEHVLLVDDFYGSGTTLLRPGPDANTPYKGRLWRTKKRLDQLQANTLSEGYSVSILVYIASSTADTYVRKMVADANLDWRFDVIQLLPEELKVVDPEILRICDWHYDPILVDRHKPQRAPTGFGGASLPLVLHHNTPNNSVCILWADTTDREGSLARHGLFPRYERHREDRA